ncbi:flavodoxin-dependent (E)-4-hydroxy-3-methylbut-2-enyl-diphosphate synthase [Candidatus Sumerlaeota bacterium]|nr:flavodoxin-dependent (E)-4-hydroxy-3-methylbut-2-enyl-diphosphate synthase [Candidatus Sumerlaeota bacterium]
MTPDSEIVCHFPRRKTKPVYVGRVKIGDGAPISVQSMTKTFTHDVAGTLNQIRLLAQAGCDIVRVAVPDRESVIALKQILRESPLPVVADIHFDPQLALMSIDAGVQGLRLNPGTIGNRQKIAEIAAAAGERRIPIRVGVNSGSLRRHLMREIEEGRLSLPEAMVLSAEEQIHILEDNGFDLIKVSLKAHDVLTTLQAHRLMAERCSYPFHCGITESGPPEYGSIKSAVGLALLISEGLADTVRVSLTAEPVEEVRLALSVLESMGLRVQARNIISCPTCARREIDVVQWVYKVEKVLQEHNVKNITVAVMGCVVNGPGEARDADIGITGSAGKAVIFRHGKVVATVPEEELIPTFVKELQQLISSKSAQTERK